MDRRGKGRRNWWAELKADPERWAAYQAKQHERFALRKANPELYAKYKARNHEWHKGRYKTDPQFAERKRVYARQRARQLKVENPEAWLADNRRTSLRHVCRRQGITGAEYDAIIEAQGGLCAICGKAETHTRNGVLCRLALDHDHETGEFRGALCRACNSGLGHFGDDTSTLWRAFEYLTKANRRLRLVS